MTKKELNTLTSYVEMAKRLKDNAHSEHGQDSIEYTKAVSAYVQATCMYYGLTNKHWQD